MPYTRRQQEKKTGFRNDFLKPHTHLAVYNRLRVQYGFIGTILAVSTYLLIKVYFCILRVYLASHSKCSNISAAKRIKYDMFNVCPFVYM